MNDVSVIVVNWNGKKFLAECFDSLRNQICRPLSIFLVDNGSNDDSVNFTKNNYPEVKIIALSNNHGFCAANNIAIKMIGTEYIALLNNDAVAHPSWLSKLMEALRTVPDASFAASKMLFYDKQDIIDRAGDGYSTSATGLLRGRNQSAAKYNTSEFIFGACAGAALYKTQIFKDVGLFDEDFFLVYEDVDLSFRAQLKGYKCIYVPEAMVYHKTSGSIGNNSSASVYYSQRNMEWVYIKNMPKELIGKTLFNHFSYNIGAFFYFAAMGKGRIFVRSKWDAIKAYRKMMGKRVKIQKEKRVNHAYIKQLCDDESLLSRLKSKLHPKGPIHSPTFTKT